MVETALRKSAAIDSLTTQFQGLSVRSNPIYRVFAWRNRMNAVTTNKNVPQIPDKSGHYEQERPRKDPINRVTTNEHSLDMATA